MQAGGRLAFTVVPQETYKQKSYHQQKDKWYGDGCDSLRRQSSCFIHDDCAKKDRKRDKIGD